MRVILKPGTLVLVPDTDAEREAWAEWRTAMAGHVFHFDGGSAKGGAWHDLGPRDEACRTPINILFDGAEPRFQLISNLGQTPFILRGRRYASVEGFWQGLKFPEDADRLRVAALWGKEAKAAARAAPQAAGFVFEGQSHRFGDAGHRGLMREAARAKFTQHAGARAALLATGDRPLTHRVRRDSTTIPGALMADIWMRIRDELAGGRSPVPADVCAEADGRILYFARDRAAFGFLSHFHPAPIELDGENWPTVEHYFQAQKSFEPAYRTVIRAAATPAAAKQLAADPDPRRPAAQKSWFLNNGAVPRSDWSEARLAVMRRADAAKFAQHPELAAALLATGSAELVEDSPFEPFWGVGQDGAGLNWAGRVLMEIREALKFSAIDDDVRDEASYYCEFYGF